MTTKERIASMVAAAAGEEVSKIEVSVPETEDFGHYSTNAAMRLRSIAAGGAAIQGRTPMERAEVLAAKIRSGAPADFFEKVEAAAPGFVNFWLAPAAIEGEFAHAARERGYGTSSSGGGKTVIVEYSSVNIAKPFHLGHLRNTVLGDALANIMEAQGYKVVRWNYLGDWGTQFGKLIAAYRAWGDKEAVEKRPIEELQKLYVRFHAEAEARPELEVQGREEFKKLEGGDAENRKLWEWFKKESLAEFKRIYAKLGVDFDVWMGESSFEKEIGPLVEDLEKRGIAEESEGALVIRLDEFNLPPALVRKTDGASLYLTRDIANLEYRLSKYGPSKILYIVGNEQSFAFAQLFAVAKKLGIAQGAGHPAAELAHVKYGLVLGEAGKKFSTRRGDAVSAAEVMARAVDLARKIVDAKARELGPDEREGAAEAVGIGALKYANLKENRMTDIIFDWERMLDLAGDSGPYIQYTHARFASILRKAEASGEGARTADRYSPPAGRTATEPELALMRKILEFPDASSAAAAQYSTSILAAYAYKLAAAANRFYETTPVMAEGDPELRSARIAITAVAARTLRDALALLGLKAPERI